MTARQTARASAHAKRGGFLSKDQRAFHAMLLLPILFIVIFNYIPMGGVIIAFKNYKPGLGIWGSEWVGLDVFRKLLALPDAMRALRNTLIIAVLKIIVNMVVPVVFALLLNEVRRPRTKKLVQTVTLLPYFLSWVVLAGVFIDILSTNGGIVNRLLGVIGVGPIFFLGSNDTFRGTMVLTDAWKNFGYNTIVYLAALTAIDPSLYEAASVDGAGRWRQTLHITLPGIATFIALMSVLSIGNILNAGFDQIYNMYNVAVYESGDIIDTLVYRLSMQQQQYSLSTAVGLFKSVVCILLISSSNYLAVKYAGYQVF